MLVSCKTLLHAMDRCLGMEENNSGSTTVDAASSEPIQDEDSETPNASVELLTQACFNGTRHSEILSYIALFAGHSHAFKMSLVNRSSAVATREVRHSMQQLYRRFYDGVSFDHGRVCTIKPSVFLPKDVFFWRILLTRDQRYPFSSGSNGLLQISGDTACITMLTPHENKTDVDQFTSNCRPIGKFVNIVSTELNNLEHTLNNTNWGMRVEGQVNFFIHHYFPGEVPNAPIHIPPSEETLENEMHRWLLSRVDAPLGEIQSFCGPSGVWHIRGRSAQFRWNGVVLFKENLATVWLIGWRWVSHRNASAGFRRERSWYYTRYVNLDSLSKLQQALSDEEDGLLNFRRRRWSDCAFPDNFNRE